MKNAIGNKLFLVIFVPFILIFGVLSVYISHISARYVTDWIMLETKGLSELNAIDLEGRIFSIIVSVSSAADAIELIDTKAENSRAQADGIVKTLFDNMHVYNAWLAYEPDSFDGRDSAYTGDYPGAPSGRFIRSYIVHDGQFIMVDDMDERTLDDSTQSPWYVIPRDNGKIYLEASNAYHNLWDYKTGEDPVYSLSVVAPIHKDGVVVGCVGADLLFDETTFGFTGDGSSAIAVFHPNGRILYSSDIKYAGVSIETMGFSDAEKIKDALSSGRPIALQNEYSIFLDSRAFTYFQPVNIRNAESDGMYLYVATGRFTADVILRPLFVLIAVIFTAALAVISIMIMYISKRISKPIRNLTLAADAISQGDLETEIASFANTNDEISLLSQSLHRMVEQFRVYILRLEQAQDTDAIRTQIEEFIRQPRSAAAVMLDISAMLCEHIKTHAVTAVIIDDGRANVAAYFDVDKSPDTTSGVHPFMHHSQTVEMLADKSLMYFNSHAITEHNISFMDAETVSACIVPLRTGKTLHGYIILENRDRNRVISARDEALLIYMADALSGWLLKNAGQTAPELESGIEPGHTSGEETTDDPSSYTGALADVRAIEYLSVDSAVDAMGGLTDVYEQSLRLFTRLIPETIEALDECIDGDLHAFTIQIHKVKGSLNNIGAYMLGKTAEGIEKAAASGAEDLCAERYPPFRSELMHLYELLEDAFKLEVSKTKQPGSADALSSAIDDALSVLRDYDLAQAMDTISPILNFSFGGQLDAELDDVFRALEVFDCEKAIEGLERIRDSLYNSGAKQ